MITIEDLMQFWPIVLALILLAAAWGKFKGDVNANSEKTREAATTAAGIKGYLFKKDGTLIYCTVERAEALRAELKGDLEKMEENFWERHEKICRINFLEFSQAIAKQIKADLAIDTNELARAVAKAIKED